MTTPNKNQMSILRAIAGLEKYAGQSNHYINGAKALVRAGFLSETWTKDKDGMTWVSVSITESGRKLLES